MQLEISVLDCAQPDCQKVAAHANRSVYYDLDYIKARVEEARKTVQRATELLHHWELNLEAKQRAEKSE